MVWVYSIILAVSAGLFTFALGRVVGRLATLLGIPLPTQNLLSYAALSALAFLTVAQAPPMMLTSAFILWMAATRHIKNPLSMPVQIGLVMLAVMLGIASLSSPNFNLPTQIPKGAIMFAVYVVWCLSMALPLGAPSKGLLASIGASLAIFIVGCIALQLPTALASDSIVIAGALLGAFFSLNLSNSHAELASPWVVLYLLGFLMACAVYSGAWWLGVLGMAPVCVYALARKA